jgi:hypothetical protein
MTTTYKPNIRAYVEYPPGPTPPFWRAYDDNLGADTSPYGVGSTREEAIEDLMWKLEDMFGCR